MITKYNISVITSEFCVGYIIPAGWAILAVTSALQLDPNTFEDPLAFNPWRWKVVEIEDSCEQQKHKVMVLNYFPLI